MASIQKEKLQNASRAMKLKHSVQAVIRQKAVILPSAEFFRLLILKMDFLLLELVRGVEIMQLLQKGILKDAFLAMMCRAQTQHVLHVISIVMELKEQILKLTLRILCVILTVIGTTAMVPYVSIAIQVNLLHQEQEWVSADIAMGQMQYIKV